MDPLFDRSVLAFLDFVSSTRRIAALYVVNFLLALTFLFRTGLSLMDALVVHTNLVPVGHGDHAPASTTCNIYHH